MIKTVGTTPTFLDRLRASRLIPAAVMQQFLLHRRSFPSAIFAFVEGWADRQYLQVEIRRRADLLNRNYFFLICDGKDGVLRALADVNRRYPGSGMGLFFVDRDFDNYIPVQRPTDPRLYVTDWYSIENHLVGEEALTVVLCDFGSLQHGDARIAEILSQYQSELARFARFMRRFIAGAIVCKRSNTAICLGDVRLGQAFKIDKACGVHFDRNKARNLMAMAGVHNPPPSGAIASQMRALRLADIKMWLRGKFELWFFVKFADRVSQALRENAIAGERPFPANPVTERNAFQELSGRVRYPRSLLLFLDNRLGAV